MKIYIPLLALALLATMTAPVESLTVPTSVPVPPVCASMTAVDNTIVNTSFNPIRDTFL